MQKNAHLLGFVGSLRKGSYNRKIFNYIQTLLPHGVSLEEGLYGHLPLFDQDGENPLPEAVVALQKKIIASDGILIVTPEFNRSIPGAFKNMIDWCSRGELEDCFKGKKIYIMGASSGNLGTVTAHYDLSRIMLYFGAYVMGTPEVFIGRVKEKFAEDGTLTDESTQSRVRAGVEAFLEFVKK